jgi:predicted permease
MNTLWLDVREALRVLTKKRPGFSLLAVIMLGTGIGATTSIYSVFYTVLLQPLPFPEPERLVSLWETRRQHNWSRASFTEANFWDIRDRNRTFEDVAAFHDLTANITSSADPEQIEGGIVSVGFFRVLGVQPVLGRDFLGDEEKPGRENVLLLRHRFWRSHFGGDPQIVGRTVRLDNKMYQVVGVLPPGEPWLDSADVFVPMVRRTDANRGSFEYAVIGRLARGVTMRAAEADLQTICESLAQQFPKDDGGMGVVLASSREWLANEDLRTKLWVLMGSVGFLLLIACVNLANLLLVKATGQTRDLAVRAALGAGRGRIVRLVLVESLILAFAGAAIGVLLALVAVDLLQNASLPGIPRIEQLAVDPWVLVFALATALLTGVLSGLVPAIQAPHRDIVSSLREGDRSQTGSRTQRRWRGALVTAEVSLSLMLLVGAGLLIRSFERLLSVDRGFHSDSRLLFGVNVPESYKPERSEELMARFFERAHAVPGVTSMAAVNSRPIVGWDPGMGIVASERPQERGFPWAGWRIVSGGYFRTMGVPLLKGRTFTQADQIGKPWRIIVSQRLAGRLWPGQDPIGRQALLWKGQGNLAAEVIGVAGNQRERGLEADPTMTVYLPSYGAGPGPWQFVVHTAIEPTSVAPALRGIMKELDATLPLADVQTLDQVVTRSVAPRRFNMLLLTVFAGIALLLAMTGVYGVLAYSVARRSAEIGLRMALGATPQSILALVMTQGMLPILAGIAIGLAGALALSRFMGSLLFGVKAIDPPTYIAVALAVALTALISCCVPAWRALRVDPVAALRQE